MKKVNECLVVNGKKWFMAVVCALVMAATVCGCGSSSDGTGVDDGHEDEDVPTYVPVESKLVEAMATYPIAGMQYDKRSFAMFSEAKSGNEATDEWQIHVGMVNDPGYGKWNESYQLTGATAYVKGFEVGNPWQIEKALLRADTDSHGIVKDAWVKFADLGEKDQYDRKKYKVELHIGLLKEKNGDYARNVDLTYTGFMEGGMLEY